MLRKLERRLEAEEVTNVRPPWGELGEGVMEEGSFDRVLLVMVLGEVRDRAAALRQLHAARSMPPGSGSSRGSAVCAPTR